MIRAPWTDEQVRLLNRTQQARRFHPFTCPTAHPEGRDLVATREGWICPHCDYTQDWAHDFMATEEAGTAWDWTQLFSRGR